MFCLANTRGAVLQGIAAGIRMSNFLRAFLMMCLNSSSSGSMKKIRRNCLAFFLGHTLIGRSVVWTCDKGSCNHMKEARQQGTTLDKGKKRSSGRMLMTLKRAVDGHRSTSNDKLRLLMQSCFHVPTTKMRVSGHFRHDTFLLPWKVGQGETFP